MSLHLIESTKVRKQSPQKRGGAMASVVIHALLVVGAFTVATAAPVEIQKPVDTELIYVAPPEPAPRVEAPATSESLAPPSGSPPTLALPVIPELTTIPVEIPPVDAGAKFEITTRDFSRRGGSTTTGVGDGSGLGGGGTTIPAGVILSDLQVERQVSILSGYRVPRYPEMLRSMGVEETINATFVVDTLGRIESGSLEIADTKHMPFVFAVREALANARFRPAEVAGRRVRQRVSQAFVFSLQR